MKNSGDAGSLELQAGLSPAPVPHAKAPSYKAEGGELEGRAPLSPHSPFMPPSYLLLTQGPASGQFPAPLTVGGKPPLAKDRSQSSTCHQGPRQRNAT